MKPYGTYIFDIDGTLIRGNEALLGAVETLKHLRETNTQILLVTNNPAETKGEISKRLNQIGFEIRKQEIITPIDALKIYFQNHQPTILAITNNSIKEEMRNLGWQVVSEYTNSLPISYVLMGMSQEITYKDFVEGVRALDNGASLLGMNPDLFCPTQEGRVPDTGALLSCLELSTGQKATIVGKPTKWMRRAILSAIHHPVSQSVFIGDSPYTDLAMGVELGMDTVLLHTGITKYKNVELIHQPTRLLNDLQELYEAING
ncbi:HAD-IIA family hydrolase [Bacillus sp. 31A1R]|uniref:HAD-IIA family hydrolase n=1 Tax=Robertmurraya mangrovi TaxID=3098077 RepID=A0ABU5J1J6_9BACI|nr:HAD-IIA family hydrolase [Bacillus sp. 31A1R]MDZ5473292.1 HAD-IIA family hydrolase [Bacillus sp. 31A1R]